MIANNKRYQQGVMHKNTTTNTNKAQNRHHTLCSAQNSFVAMQLNNISRTGMWDRHGGLLSRLVCRLASKKGTTYHNNELRTSMNYECNININRFEKNKIESKNKSNTTAK